MILTESEARQRWCPFAREIERHDAVAATNRETMCMGSRCMAWRYVSGGLDEEERGYCGLAGQPYVSGSNLLEARINPDDYTQYLNPDLYGTEDTVALAQALLDAGIHIGQFRGFVVIGGEAVALQAVAHEPEPYGADHMLVHLSVRARVPDPRGSTLIDLETTLPGLGRTPEAAIANAAEMFVAGAVDPLRRAVADDALALSDLTLNLRAHEENDAEFRSTEFFMVFRGALQTGAVNEHELVSAFRFGVIDWMFGQGPLELAPDNMALIKISATRTADGVVTTDCTIKGEPWLRGNKLLQGFDWPEAEGAQMFREFVVLRIGG